MTTQTKAQNISLRPIKDQDSDFLYKLYAQTREAEINMTGWTPEQATVFLQQQFRAQTTYWGDNYDTTRFELILWKNKPAGRFYVDEMPEELRLVDIIVDESFRGKGIGAVLIRQLLEEATEKNKPVTLHVEANNWVKSFYEKLGFKVIKPHEVHSFMRWEPTSFTH